MPKKLLYYRLRILAFISIIWIIFGVISFENLLRTATDIAFRVRPFPFIIAFGITGFFICGMLIFYLKPAFNHHPVWLAVTYKMLSALILFSFIAFVLLLVYYVAHQYHGTLQHYLQVVFTKLIFTKTFFILMMDTGVMALLSIAMMEVNDTYGPGMFWSMLRGQYHQPKRENRIFVFLDINESTSIAEQLGHEQYFHMLRRFFGDLTHPVIINEGKIYQYVGDEMVITWHNTPENKAKCLKFIRNTFFLMERKKEAYIKRFGRAPQFKAGIHAGEVTAGFIGVIKKELVFCGDTLNTTARICSLCNEVGEPFILSEDFMQDFSKPAGYEIEFMGEKELKGRVAPTKIFSLKFE